MNNTKECNRVMNNNKNKLNSQISWVFKLEPSAYKVKEKNNVD